MHVAIYFVVAYLNHNIIINMSNRWYDLLSLRPVLWVDRAASGDGVDFSGASFCGPGRIFWDIYLCEIKQMRDSNGSLFTYF